MEMTTLEPKSKNIYTSNTKLFGVRLPLHLVEKLNATGNASAAIRKAVEDTYGKNQPAASKEAAPIT